MVRRTKEEAAQTSEDILRAAEKLFQRKGFDSVSLEEIATSAGVTRGAVHWHFKNKQGLIAAIRGGVEKRFRNLETDLHAIDSASPIPDLGNVISEMFARLHSNPDCRISVGAMFRIHLAGGHMGRPYEVISDAAQREFERVFEAADRNAGLSKAWTPQKAASLLSVNIAALLMVWSLREDVIKIHPDGTLSIDAFLRGLGKSMRA